MTVHTDEDHTTALSVDMPEGRAWEAIRVSGTRVRQLMVGLASTLKRMEAWVQQFKDDLTPDETQHFIDEWEQALGIPCECFLGSGTDAERRRDILAKISAMGVHTAQDFVDFAERFGITIEVYGGSHHGIFPMTFPIILFGSAKEARFTVVVWYILPDDSGFPFTFPFIFRNRSLNILECFFRAMIPANCNLIFKQREVAAPVPSLPVTAGLVLWLDASDETSVSATANKVTQWNDKSGAGITGNFSPITAFSPNYGLIGDRINGLNTVSFVQESAPLQEDMALRGTGTDSLKGVDGMTVYVVHECDETQYQYTYTSTTYTYSYYTTVTYTSTYTSTDINNSGAMLFKGKAGDYLEEYKVSPGQFRMSRGSGSPTFDGVSNGIVSLNPTIIADICDATGALTEVRSYKNGSNWDAEADFQAYNDNVCPHEVEPHYIGGAWLSGTNLNQHYNGSIGEMIVFNRALTAGERAQMDNYLSVKWGISI